VQSAPYAYDQGAEAKPDDPESTPLRWFCHHPRWEEARSGGIGRRILHLFCGSVDTTDPAKRRAWGFTRLRDRAAIYMLAYWMHYVFGMGRCHDTGNHWPDSGYVREPSIVCLTVGQPWRLSLDLSLMATGLEEHVKSMWSLSELRLHITTALRNFQFAIIPDSPLSRRTHRALDT
jgi:hypothetical protein